MLRTGDGDLRPNFELARAYALRRLARELPPQLSYHSLRHTRDDVLPACLMLAEESGLDEEATLCLTTAAVYHDTGFLYSYAEHEAHSIALARVVLPRFGYCPDTIDTIASLIAATRMPQAPPSPLAELLCDADLDLLGREDFWELNRCLLDETCCFGGNGVVPEEEWLAGQMRFLQEHTYFSEAARRRRDDGKARNMARMQQALAASNGDGRSHTP